MSRRLFLMRHAKSSWNDSELDDFDRPLNKRGREAAPAMGKVMAEEGWEPDYVFCSSAKRTQQTLDRVLAKLNGEPELVIADDLYLASAPHILKRIRSTPEYVENLLVVGHNPGIEILANDLAAFGDVDLLNRLYQKYPTAALAVIDLGDSKWRDIPIHSGTLIAYIRPRQIEEDRP